MSRKTVIRVPDGPPGHPFLSPAIRAGDFVFVSGNAGLRPGSSAAAAGGGWQPGDLVPGGIQAETRQTLQNIKAALEAAGATLSDVVKVNTFLRDVDRDFHAYNEVYLEFFPTDPPARTTVGAKIYGLILVEIECVAFAPGGAASVTHDIVIPQLGLMEDATVQEWLRADGEHVRAGEMVVSIQTDKAAVEIESPAEGILRILVPAGPDPVSVETVLGTVEAAG